MTDQLDEQCLQHVFCVFNGTSNAVSRAVDELRVLSKNALEVLRKSSRWLTCGC
jgi:hypothetical protein